MVSKIELQKSFKWSFFIQLSFQLIGFAVSIFLARILSPSDFGVIGILTIFINLSKKITDGGLASSLIRSNGITERDFSTVFYFNLICSVLLYVLLFFFSHSIANFFEIEIIEDLLKVFGLSIIISAFTITQSVKLNKELKFKTQFKILLPSLVLSGVIGIGAANYGYGVWSLVIKEIVFAVSGSIQLWYYSKWKPLPIFDVNLIKVHLNFGYKLVLTDLFSQFFKDINKGLIGKLFSSADLGFFTRAKSMEELPNSVIFNTINRVMFPLLSKVQDDSNQLKNLYSKIIKVVSFIVIPFLMLLFIIADPFFIFLLTEKWLSAVPYFKILLIAGMIGPLQPYLLNICKVKGRSDLVLKLSIVEYVFVFLSMLAIFPFGILGLLWGLVVATLAKLIVAMFYSGRLINYSFKNQILDLKEGFLSGVAAFGFITLLYQTGLFSNMFPIVELVLVSGLFYIIIILGSILLKFESVHLVKTLFLQKKTLKISK